MLNMMLYWHLLDYWEDEISSAVLSQHNVDNEIQFHDQNNDNPDSIEASVSATTHNKSSIIPRPKVETWLLSTSS